MFEKSNVVLALVLVLTLTVFMSGMALAEEETEEDLEIAEPLLITSAGQSPCYQLFNTILGQFDVEAALVDSLATVEDLEGHETLVVAIGGSGKGLGEAGIDPEDELERATEVIEEAREREMDVIGVHTGQMDRFGDISQLMIEGTIPLTDYTIVVDHEDFEDFFVNIAEEHEVPLEKVEDRMGAGELFSELMID